MADESPRLSTALKTDYMKKVLAYLAKLLVYTLILGVVYPFTDRMNFYESYTSPEYWLTVFISAFVIYNIIFYFETVNPRIFYCFVDGGVVFAVVVAVILAFLGLVIAVAMLESAVLKISFVILGALVGLFVIYASVYRGIAVYEKGKIRVFDFKIKTYNTMVFDSVSFECNGNKCTCTAVINGEASSFKFSAKNEEIMRLKLCAVRIKKN